ncbi:MAG: hypothetical protein ACNA8W_25050, partial [Bradymonadaceae bacterium]
GEERDRLAAFSTSTGELTPWKPVVEGGNIHDMKVHGDRLYIAGQFTTMGGADRRNLASLSLATGEVTDWDPRPDQEVEVIEPMGDVIYAGGGFQNIGGQPRLRIGAVSTITGEATAWDPGANHRVRVLAAGEDVLYASGAFSNIGGVQQRFVAISHDTGEVMDWAPWFSFTVTQILPFADTVLFSGFNTGLRILEKDASAEYVSWFPDFNATVRTFVVADDLVYFVGDFTTIDGQSRRGLSVLRLPAE